MSVQDCIVKTCIPSSCKYIDVDYLETALIGSESLEWDPLQSLSFTSGDESLSLITQLDVFMT